MVFDARTDIRAEMTMAQNLGSGIGGIFGNRPDAGTIERKRRADERQQKAFLEQWEQEKTSALVGVMHDPNLTTKEKGAKLRGIPEMTKSKAYQKAVLGGQFDENPMEEYKYWTGIRKVADDAGDEEGVRRADFNLERIYKKFPGYAAYQESKIPATAADIDPDNPSPLPQDEYEQVMRDAQAKVPQAHPTQAAPTGPLSPYSPVDVEIEQIVGPPSPEFVGPQQKSGQKSPYEEYPDAFLEGGVWKVMKDGKKYKILDD